MLVGKIKFTFTGITATPVKLVSRHLRKYQANGRKEFVSSQKILLGYYYCSLYGHKEAFTYNIVHKMHTAHCHLLSSSI